MRSYTITFTRIFFGTHRIVVSWKNFNQWIFQLTFSIPHYHHLPNIFYSVPTCNLLSFIRHSYLSIFSSNLLLVFYFMIWFCPECIESNKIKTVLLANQAPVPHSPSTVLTQSSLNPIRTLVFLNLWYFNVSLQHLSQSRPHNQALLAKVYFGFSRGTMIQ